MTAGAWKVLRPPVTDPRGHIIRRSTIDRHPDEPTALTAATAIAADLGEPVHLAHDTITSYHEWTIDPLGERTEIATA